MVKLPEIWLPFTKLNVSDAPSAFPMVTVDALPLNKPPTDTVPLLVVAVIITLVFATGLKLAVRPSTQDPYPLVPDALVDHALAASQVGLLPVL